MVRLVLTVILMVLVTACNSLVLRPTHELVQKAIALQLGKTQEQIAQQLNLDSQKFDINHLSITEQKLFNIENLPTFRVRGTYDLTVKLLHRSFTEPQKGFEVLLQIQQEGKTWRLLLPEKTSSQMMPIWHSYSIL
jgi:alanyl-tRNA synthetase